MVGVVLEGCIPRQVLVCGGGCREGCQVVLVMLSGSGSVKWL